MRFGIEKYYYKADSDERANGQRDRRRNYELGGGLGGRRKVDDAVFFVFFSYLRAATLRISPTQMHHRVRGFWVRPLASDVWSEGNSITAEAGAPFLLAEMGFSDLGSYSVAFAPPSEVLNQGFGEYPPGWPLFHRAEASFMELIKDLTCRQHTTTLSSVPSGLSTAFDPWCSNSVKRHHSSYTLLF